MNDSAPFSRCQFFSGSFDASLKYFLSLGCSALDLLQDGPALQPCASLALSSPPSLPPSPVPGDSHPRFFSVRFSLSPLHGPVSKLTLTQMRLNRDLSSKGGGRTLLVAHVEGWTLLQAGKALLLAEKPFYTIRVMPTALKMNVWKMKVAAFASKNRARNWMLFINGQN